jgi:CubicO group peptidase (beta-lactamase class C family)
MSDQEFKAHGICEERFEPLKEVFENNFKKGLDVGASFAVTINSKFVVDLWGGYADANKTRPWEKDTIINVYSTTKVMTALCIHILVDRGLIDLDAPVAQYWPEFAQAGKGKIPVRYLLSHTSGLAGYDEKLIMEDLFDWDRIVKILAAQAPWWGPGTRSGYHTSSFGFLLGELVRRVTGKTLGNFFREEVATSLKADFHIGFSKELDSRVADLIEPEKSMLIRLSNSKFILKLLKNTILIRSVMNPIIRNEVTKTRAFRAAEIPASNGHGNARSIALIGAILACGGKVGNKRFLESSTIEKAIEEQYKGKDLVLRSQMRWGLGFALNDKSKKYGSNLRTFSWGGLGGSILLMDPDAKVSMAFAMNKMNMSLLGDPRTKNLIKTLDKIIYD